MTRLRTLGYTIAILSLTLGLLNLSSGGSQATSLSITNTPSLTLTDAPPPTDTPPTDTPPTDTPPTDTPTVTPTLFGPAPTPTPPNTPTAISPATPTTTTSSPGTTPLGTITLPQAGQSNPLPVSLLLVVAGGLLALWAWLLRQSDRSS